MLTIVKQKAISAHKNTLYKCELVYSLGMVFYGRHF